MVSDHKVHYSTTKVQYPELERFRYMPDEPGGYVIAAAASGHLEILKTALASGGSLNTWAGKRHLLHIAAACGRANIVEFLLDNGIDPNLRTDDFQNGGSVPLAYALQAGVGKAPGVMKVLLDHGADPFAKDEPATYGKPRAGAKTTLELIDENYRHCGVPRGRYERCEDLLKQAQKAFKPPRAAKPKETHAADAADRKSKRGPRQPGD